jgi:hypothetical protein
MALQLANFAVAHDHVPLARTVSLFVIQKDGNQFFIWIMVRHLIVACRLELYSLPSAARIPPA